MSRGYTGHEHLDKVGLINMNGRMYDPRIGRMLSPDNLVPNPYSLQGYNRYAYAMNNPMLYVDPDGENPIAWIGMGLYAIFSYFKAAQDHNWEFNLRWAKRLSLRPVKSEAPASPTRVNKT